MSNIEEIIQICNDEIVERIDKIYLVRNKSSYQVISAITGEVLTKEYEYYSEFNGYLILEDSDQNIQVYSPKKNELWGKTAEAGGHGEHGITIFSDYATYYDRVHVLVFVDSTGDMIWDFKILKPRDDRYCKIKKKKLEDGRILHITCSKNIGFGYGYTVDFKIV